MISGIFHPGSGLGNQLHRYVATRVIAYDRKLPFGMVGTEFFKGRDFMNLEFGHEVLATYIVRSGGKLEIDTNLKRFEEKKVENEEGIDIRGFDLRVDDIEDNTLIDGEFQHFLYFGHHIPILRYWLKTEPLGMPNDLCVVGFRGGEFQAIPDLYLPREYWNTAIEEVKKINRNMRFQCVTDDPAAAARMLPPEVRITHDIGTDWRLIRNARYLIIANSSFYILPSLLNENARLIIAPKYWARRGKKVWATEQNYYPSFSYI